MPLTMVRSGDHVRIRNIHGGRRLSSRLAAMGLVPGTEIEVLEGGLRGPLLLSVKGCRIVLGRGVAHKIEVV